MNEDWREPSAPATPVSGGGPDEGSSRLQNLLSLAVVAVAVIAAAIFARNALVSTALFLVILLGLVMAHEAAHFFTAKAFGILVHEFAFGFPPRIWGKRIGETVYSVNWLPVGGFVRLQGEDAAEGPRSFAAQAAWKIAQAYERAGKR